MKDNVILRKSFDFSVKVIGLYQKLKELREYDLGRQLLRSGTSIGANAEEADAGASKRDFWAKMAIASKEARETRYWLRLLKSSRILAAEADALLPEVDELIRILTSIVKTTRTNIDDPRVSEDLGIER